MSEYVNFHYMPLEGKITGKQVLKQTEDAINDLGNKVYSLDIDQSEIDEAIEKSNEAINTANSALSAVTTGRSVWFNNVAEMVATDIEAGVTAETKGYYVANDGGNALYLIRQEKSGDVVDGGSLITLSNGNMAELVTDGTVNVKQFGAIGNGTDDDTTIFQNTSSYAQANGFVPFVGVATYKITGNVTGTFNSFGEVTITGGGTVDIINLQEVVSDVSDIRDEVVDETASAKAYSESAATSATSASSSASSATNTANALINFLETKETLTAPAVDPTLTISGAAADAQETGDDITSISDAVGHMLYTGNYDYKPIIEQGSCDLNTRKKVTSYANKYLRTKGLVPVDETINLKVNANNSAVRWEIAFYDKNLTFLSRRGGYATGQAFTPTDLAGASFCWMRFSKVDSSDITTADVANLVFLQYPTINRLQTLYDRSRADTQSLMSINLVGRTELSNIPFEAGRFLSGSGLKRDNSLWIRTVYPIMVSATSNLYFFINIAGISGVWYCYDENYQYIAEYNVSYNTAKTLPTNTRYVNIGLHSTDAENPIDVSDASTLVVAQSEPLYIPPYYASQVPTKIGYINNNMNVAGRNSESFVWITDVHWETNYKDSPSLIRYILNHTNVNNVFCGGDMFNEGTKPAMISTALDAVKHLQFPLANMFLPITRGNHDDNSNWSSQAVKDLYRFDYNTVFNLFYNQVKNKVTFLTNNNTEFSFYFDSNDTNTRFVFLDSRDLGQGIPHNQLIAMLNSISTDMNVVFFLHMIYTNSSATAMTMAALVLTHIIGAYKTKTSGSYAGVIYDFTNAHGKPIALIGGHTHSDISVTYNAEGNIAGVPIIITDTDSYRDHANTAGTSNSQCFDVITIDYTTKNINCVRIGRGSDRLFAFE